MMVHTGLAPRLRRRCALFAVLSGCLFLGLILTCGGVVQADEGSAAGQGEESYWWYSYPTYIDGAANLDATHARVISQNYFADPTWGYYGQYLNNFSSAQFNEAKEKGARWITWIEGFGDCCLYAVGIHQNEDGSYRTFEDAPQIPSPEINRWGWNAEDLADANVIRWVGLHNTTENEPVAGPLFTREAMGLPVPTYPDGTPAVGRMPGREYPMNLRVYDACCSKDINGIIYYSAVNETKTDPDTGKPIAQMPGLYTATVGSPELRGFRGKKPGEKVLADALSLPKDAAAPFWIDCMRASTRVIAREDIDGVWCDNFSPWDNFNASPVRKAFGDWSVALFRDYLKGRFAVSELKQMGVDDLASFDVRAYLKARAHEYGASDPSQYNDRAWRDIRWLDEPVWNAYKVFKQKVGQEGLRDLYNAIKDGARKGGRADFAVYGNDIPLFGLGWVHEDYLDVVSSEISCGWGLSTGSRGIMPPPLGKMAVVYRAALEHQKGPYAAMWYYVPENFSNKPEIGRVLLAEAFANSTFLKYGQHRVNVGTPEVQRAWNDFVHNAEPEFGRRYAMADVGILFSPDNQLSLILPGSIAPDFNRQEHFFGHWGFATAMVDAHIPYRPVTDWNLSAEELEGLRTFVIPAAECIADEAVPMLEEWVRAGGRLVITGPFGMRRGAKGHFAKRSSSVLETLVGQGVDEAATTRTEGSQDREWIETEAAVDVGRQETTRRPVDSTRTQVGDIRIHTRKLGSGTVVWSPDEAGVEYYLNEMERPDRLGGVVELVGASGILDAERLPSTVGAFCWRNKRGKTMFVDLVNYDIDTDADKVTPAKSLTFRMRLPQGAKGVKVKTLSPHKDARAVAGVRGGWATVRVAELVNFVSVRLEAE